MRPIGCAEFERGLAAILESPHATPSDDPSLELLAAHARECPACAPSAPLLEWARHGAVDRGLEPPPPAGYWDGFDARLRERLRREDRAPSNPIRVVAVAAALAIAGVGLAVIWRGRDEPSNPGPVVAASPPSDFGDAIGSADPDDSQVWRDFPSFDALDDLDNGGAALFPALDDLDPAVQERLLEWLRTQDAPATRVDA